MLEDDPNASPLRLPITTPALAMCIMHIARMPANLDLASFVLRQAQDERGF
jgi:hypothetical protein